MDAEKIILELTKDHFDDLNEMWKAAKLLVLSYGAAHTVDMKFAVAEIIRIRMKHQGEFAVEPKEKKEAPKTDDTTKI